MARNRDGDHPGLILCSECGLLWDASLFYVLKKSRGKVCLYCRQDKDLAYSRKFFSTEHGKNYNAMSAFCHNHGIRIKDVQGEGREVLMQTRALNRSIRRSANG